MNCDHEEFRAAMAAALIAAMSPSKRVAVTEAIREDWEAVLQHEGVDLNKYYGEFWSERGYYKKRRKWLDAIMKRMERPRPTYSNVRLRWIGPNTLEVAECDHGEAQGS